MLTARHVVERAIRNTGSVDVRPLARVGQEGWQGCRIAWQSPLYDVALLEVVDPAFPLPTPGGTDTLWGGVRGSVPLTCTAVGFPRSAAMGRVRETEQLVGDVLPGAGVKQGLLSFDIGQAEGEWHGMSGAALLHGPYVVGVLVEDQSSRLHGSRRIWAFPAERWVAHPGFRDAAVQLGIPIDLFALPERERRSPAAERVMTTVKDLWLTESLKPLQGKVRLDVLAIRSDHLIDADPWRTLPAEPDPDALPEPAYEAATELIDPHAVPRLLITGAAGAGKTTLLLQQARRLWNGASIDTGQPIPLPLSLQSWREGAFDKWVLHELGRRTYGVRSEDARRWLFDGAVTLMLDGLDEASEPWRSQRLDSLAEFLNNHEQFGRVGMVITTRPERIMTQPRLPLGHALRVLPLGQDEVARRLAESGPVYARLSRRVEEDAVLADVLSSPLMLDVAAATARTGDQPAPGGTAEDYRRQFFDLLLQHLLPRARDLRGNVPTGRSMRGLSRKLIRLARVLTYRGETTFYPDLLTSEWTAAGYAALPPPQRGFVGRLVTFLAIVFPGAVFMLLGAPLFLTAGVLVLGVPRGVVFGLAAAAAFGLGRGYNSMPNALAARWSWSWLEAARGLTAGILVVAGAALVAASVLATSASSGLFLLPLLLLIGLVAALRYGLSGERQAGGLATMWLGVVSGIVTGAVVGGLETPFQKATPEADPAEWIPQPLVPAFHTMVGHLADSAFDGTNIGVVAGLVGGFAAGWTGGLGFGFIVSVLGAVPGALSAGTAFALVRGLQPDPAKPAVPAQALRASGRVILVVCGASAALAGTGLWLVAREDGPVRGASAVLLVAISLLFGTGPVRDWTDHWVTRWSLATRGILPWAVTGFLERATERALLVPIGGGYRFLPHVEYQHYLAGRDEEQAAAGLPTATAVWTAPIPDHTPQTDRAVLRGWWTASAVGRLASKALSQVVEHIVFPLANLLLARKVLLGMFLGYLASGLLALAPGLGEDDVWLAAGPCAFTGGVLLFLHSGGHLSSLSFLDSWDRALSKPLDRLVSSLAVGWQWLLARTPQLPRFLRHIGVGSLAGYVLSAIPRAFPGTDAQLDLRFSLVLVGVGALAGLALALRKKWRATYNAPTKKIR
ncbi:NACHT domain-containing protein [Streptomyces sp. NPDC046909]|uniref:NACHT domain-containing protein n=1 Tax=Streptomyces sp. NPDC046909 TaxID=3155617 RepID=UPI0033DB9F05